MLVCDVKGCDKPATHRLETTMHYPGTRSEPAMHDICTDCSEYVREQINCKIMEMFDSRKTEGEMT